MRISSIEIREFRRFKQLSITDIPPTAKLMILAGPNGCGKSSILDAFSLAYQIQAFSGWSGLHKYYARGVDEYDPHSNNIKISFHGNESITKGSFYFRSAYRIDPEFVLNGLSRQTPPKDEMRFRRMIEQDATVSQNYQRLASQAMEDAFEKLDENKTLGQFREETIGTLKKSISDLFPGLELKSIGNPLEAGTFRFKKGSIENFEYMNLSGGEKAAFDIILDILLKQSSFPKAVYCIDEPEIHMNTRIQSDLLDALYKLTPADGQLWLATHSIGMMRRARELYYEKPGEVVFLDFGGSNFDEEVTLQPSKPSRAFWEGVLNVALDDLAELVTPREVIVCEGNPAGPTGGKNAEHDARIFNEVFADEYPDTKFIAGGSSNDVAADRIAFVKTLPRISSGLNVRRLIDRDDHGPSEVAEFAKQNVSVLSRRHIEAYVYADDILIALCHSLGQPEIAQELIDEKNKAITETKSQGYPDDDVKAAAGLIFNAIRRLLRVSGKGNDQRAFARNALAHLITPDTDTYQQLKRDIFGG